jgi:hypothetical protein
MFDTLLFQDFLFRDRIRNGGRMVREKRNSAAVRSVFWFTFVLLILPDCVSAAQGQAAASGRAKSEVRVLDPVGVILAAEAVVPPAPRLNGLSGKKVWVVVVDNGSTLMPAVAALLPKYAPGVRIRTILTAETGNPFFMLKAEDRPDAVIAGTGVCEDTTLNAANYARQAEKLNIPAVISFSRDIHYAYQQAIDKLQSPSTRACATELPDAARPGDPERIAQKLIPQFIEGLTRAAGADRPRICFTGPEDRARAYIETLRWTGGMPVTLPTEERVAALLKGTSHQPAEVIGIMPPGLREATVEKVAVHAAMAGCTPEQMPFALALAEMLCQKRVAEKLGQREPPVLQIAVGGPAAGTIGAAGSPGENSIGRLARLMLIHLGGIPGPVFEEKSLWTTLPEQVKSGESTVSLLDAEHSGIWKEAKTTIDKWR